MENDDITVVIAQAIKTHFWKEIYGSLQNGGKKFELVFVGHIKPNFRLPPNMTWVECDLSPAMCAEVAYRYTYKHFPEAKYIVNIADDLLIPPNFLKDNIAFYETQKKKLNVEVLLSGPVCLVSSGFENLMAWKNGGPALLVTNFTEIETSKKIGGIDSRFEAIYWDCDRMLRVHEMGGEVVVAMPEELSPIREREHIPGLYHKYGRTDKNFLDELWLVQEGGENSTNCCSLNQEKNVSSRKMLTIKRRAEIKEYAKVELEKHYE